MAFLGSQSSTSDSIISARTRGQPRSGSPQTMPCMSLVVYIALKCQTMVLFRWFKLDSSGCPALYMHTVLTCIHYTQSWYHPWQYKSENVQAIKTLLGHLLNSYYKFCMGMTPWWVSAYHLCLLTLSSYDEYYDTCRRLGLLSACAYKCEWYGSMCFNKECGLNL